MVGVLKTEGRRPGIQDERRPYIRHSFVSAIYVNSSHGTFHTTWKKAKVLSFDSSGMLYVQRPMGQEKDRP